VRLDPREGRIPIVILAHGFRGVIDEAACLWVAGGEEGFNFPGLAERKKSFIISFEKEGGEGEFVVLGG
jgi:hypothetical protein